MMKEGKVTLVGAGPGDPELLTLKALKAIQAATVLLVDDLVSPEIVAHAAPGARVVHVLLQDKGEPSADELCESLGLADARGIATFSLNDKTKLRAAFDALLARLAP